MAAGIDVSVAGSKPADSLDPLVRALDQYSSMLQAVANSLEGIVFPEFPELPKISIKDELQSFLEQLGIIAEKKEKPAPKPTDPRYNPELDAALGIGPPVEKTKPSIPEPPKVEIPKAEPTPAPAIEPEKAPKLETNPTPEQPPSPQGKKSLFDNEEIKGAMSAFKGIGNIGNIASTVAKGLGGLAVALDIATKVVEEVFDLVEVALEPLNDFIKAIGDALEPLAKAIATLLQTALKPFMLILQAIGNLIQLVLLPFVSALKAIGKLIEIVFAPLKIFGKLIDILARPLQVLGEIFDALSEAAEALFVPLEVLADVIELLLMGIPDWIKALNKSAKVQRDVTRDILQFSKSLKTVVDDLVRDPVSKLPALINEIRDSVELFNPGAMLEFDLAMRDLKAVLGEFLVPIVKQAAIVLRVFADTLRPILLAMAPMFQKLVGAVGDQLMMRIQTFAEMLQYAIPALKDYIKAQLDAAERQMLIAEQMSHAKTWLGKAALWVADHFMTNKNIADLNQVFRKQKGGQDIFKKEAMPGARGLAVAQNATFSGIAELARGSMLQAFIGTSGMAAMKNKKQDEAVDNVANLNKVIKDAAKNAFVEALREHDRNKPVEKPRGALPFFGGGN